MHGLFGDPKTWVIFHKVFGQREHRHLLIDLLHTLLGLDEAHRIVDLEHLPPQPLPSLPPGRQPLLDVRCTDARGVRYVVDLQVIEIDGLQRRVMYEACRDNVDRLESGYPEPDSVIAVVICDVMLWPAAERVPMWSRWRHRGATGLPDLLYVFLELPKYTAADHPRTAVERWAYLFREARVLKQVPEALSSAPYAEALQAARLANLTRAEQTTYERELMAIQDMRGAITLAERRGRQMGLAEARQERLAGR